MDYKLTIEPGRNIYRNGKPFVFVGKCNGCSPVEADTFAHAIPDMFSGLVDAELRLTQARLASGIGRKKDKTAFLLGEIERVQAVIREALAKVRAMQELPEKANG